MLVLIWEAIIIIRNFISLRGSGDVRFHLRLRHPRRGRNLFLFYLSFFIIFDYYYTNNKAIIYIYYPLYKRKKYSIGIYTFDDYFSP
jgi:hypothetical protein